LIREARLFRRLALRHPPSNNQRTLALFISGGYYEALIHRLQRAYRERWETLGAALARHLPECSTMPSFGGTSYWVKGPEGLDGDRLALDALRAGVIIEAGSMHFCSDPPPHNYFRLGFSSIECERIEPGIEKLADLLHARLGATKSAAS
jgi:GntR family transcriptional regulator/MocR family aminotransferase